MGTGSRGLGVLFVCCQWPENWGLTSLPGLAIPSVRPLGEGSHTSQCLHVY